MFFDQDVVLKIASGIRRFFVATGGNVGQDCFDHAAFGHRILSDFGARVHYRVGFAAWRVGSGDGDVITHRPTGAFQMTPGAVPLHAWIEIEGSAASEPIIVDFTTYQLRAKAAALDAIDGGRTSIDWAPDCLLASVGSTSSFCDVVEGNAGQYYYEHSETLTKLVRADMKDIDEADLAHLLFIIANPSLRVLGPNHAKYGLLKVG